MIELNIQIFLNFNQSNLVMLFSVVFIPLCLKVSEWVE